MMYLTCAQCPISRGKVKANWILGAFEEQRKGCRYVTVCCCLGELDGAVTDAAFIRLHTELPSLQGEDCRNTILPAGNSQRRDHD